jgi:alpha-aminoadipic semialdehyde synthase
MSRTVAVRSETKSPWEKRVPLVPSAVRRLIEGKNLEIMVQSSSRRIFPDNDFVRAGATVRSDISSAGVVLGVKEVPPELLQPKTTYAYFSHVIKGQPYNMSMLQRLLDLGCTLIDYEEIRDDQDRRLIFFGRFAGLAGMIDSLWALGQRLKWERFDSPLATIQPAHEYDGLDAAKAAIAEAGKKISTRGMPAGLAPLIVGVAGYGNVAQGVQEILSILPTREIAPEQVAEVANDPDASAKLIYRVTFKEEHLVCPQSAEQVFELQDYYSSPEKYRSCFSPYLDHLSVLMNCNYWDERYPRLVPNEELERLFEVERQPRLRLIGDLACDVEGSIQCMTHCTEPGDPIYVYDPATAETTSGFEGRGPVILAVDILPSELPRDASEAFSEALVPMVPAIARADYDLPFDQLDLPAEIKRAVIVHQGRLTPDYRYLESFLK